MNGLATTLTANDSLDGGTGHDTLALFGGGTFNLAALAQFSGFEQVDVVNIVGGPSNLTLRDGIDLTVNIDNETGQGGMVRLASGATTLNLGNSGNYTVYASTGATTITSNGWSNSIFLATGDATITTSGFTRIFVSSGRTIADVTGSNSYVILNDVGAIDYADTFTGNGNSLFADGSGHDLDLTRLALNGSWSLNIGYWYGSSNVTVDVDQASLSHLSSISGSTKETLRTAAATLDLTGHPVSGDVSITSANATGTTFTVGDVSSGLHVLGGAGNDTLVLQNASFSAGQRAAIFAQGSIETITDSSGTYTAPVATSLTTGADTFAGTAADETVNGLATTLTANDSLDGGTGHDALALFGGGTFNLAALAQFSGFEQVDVVNIVGGQSNLTLRDGIDLTVNIDNETGQGGTVRLASGATTLNLGNSGNYTVYASTGATTITSNGYSEQYYLSSGNAVITNTRDAYNNNSYYLSTGSATITTAGYNNNIYVSSGETHINLTSSFLGANNYVRLQDVGAINYNDTFTAVAGGNSSYLIAQGAGHELDLTRLSLTNTWHLQIYDTDITVDVDQASLAHLGNISGYTNDTLRTAAATLDLTGHFVSGGISVTSTNATGTTFTVGDVSSGLHVLGGAGNDTLVLQNASFSAGQRAAIFAQGSIETITDSSGTYTSVRAPVVATVAEFLAAIATDPGYRADIVDSVANITADLTSLETYRAGINSVTNSDPYSGAPHVTVVQALDGPHVLALLATNGATGVTVADSIGTIVGSLDQLNALPFVTGVMNTDTGTGMLGLTLTSTQIVADQRILDFIGPQANVSFTVFDTAATLSANLNAVQAFAQTRQVMQVVVSDGTALTVSASQATADAGVLSKLAQQVPNPPYLLPGGSIQVVDTAADISANLPALKAAATLSGTTLWLQGVTVTDPANPVHVSSLDFASVDPNSMPGLPAPNLFDRFTGSYSLAVQWDGDLPTTGGPASGTSPLLDMMRMNGHVASITVPGSAPTALMLNVTIQQLVDDAGIIGMFTGDGLQLSLMINDQSGTAAGPLTLPPNVMSANYISMGGSTAIDLLGNALDNSLYLGQGNDTLRGGAGDDTLSGGYGNDTAVYTGNRGDYVITQGADGSFTIADQRAGAPDGTDIVADVEAFQFADTTRTAANLLVPPPTITSNGGGATAAVGVAENSNAVTTVAASDPGSTLVYSKAGGADAALFNIDPVTGALSFVTAPDFEQPADANHDNVYEVVVQAADANGSDTQAISVTVGDVNEAPTAKPDVAPSAVTADYLFNPSYDSVTGTPLHRLYRFDGTSMTQFGSTTFVPLPDPTYMGMALYPQIIKTPTSAVIIGSADGTTPQVWAIDTASGTTRQLTTFTSADFIDGMINTFVGPTGDVYFSVRDHALDGVASGHSGAYRISADGTVTKLTGFGFSGEPWSGTFQQFNGQVYYSTQGSYVQAPNGGAVAAGDGGIFRVNADATVTRISTAANGAPTSLYGTPVNGALYALAYDNNTAQYHLFRFDGTSMAQIGATSFVSVPDASGITGLFPQIIKTPTGAVLMGSADGTTPQVWAIDTAAGSLRQLTSFTAADYIDGMVITFVSPAGDVYLTVRDRMLDGIDSGHSGAYRISADGTVTKLTGFGFSGELWSGTFQQFNGQVYYGTQGSYVQAPNGGGAAAAGDGGIFRVNADATVTRISTTANGAPTNLYGTPVNGALYSLAYDNNTSQFHLFRFDGTTLSQFGGTTFARLPDPTNMVMALYPQIIKTPTGAVIIGSADGTTPQVWAIDTAAGSLRQLTSFTSADFIDGMANKLVSPSGDVYFIVHDRALDGVASGQSGAYRISADGTVTKLTGFGFTGEMWNGSFHVMDGQVYFGTQGSYGVDPNGGGAVTLGDGGIFRINADATVTRISTAANGAPTNLYGTIIAGQATPIAEDQSVTLDVLANDTDPDAGNTPSTFTLLGAQVAQVTGPSGVVLGTGTVSIVGNKLVFNPGTDFRPLNNGQTATVVINYQMADAAGATSSSTATITLSGVTQNVAPTGTPTAILPAGTEDTAYTVTTAQLLQGITDANGDTMTVTGLTASNGTVTANADGSFTITPAANYNGPVTLTYTVDDGQGGTLANVTQSYTLTAVNDAPDLLPNSPAGASYTENGGPVQVLPNASLVDADNSPSFNGGTITVTLSGGVSGDRFSVLNHLPSGAEVQVAFIGGVLNVGYGGIPGAGGVTVATLSGLGSSSMTFTLNANANKAVVEAILQSLVFDSLSENPTAATRTATVTFNDGGNSGGGALFDSVTVPISVVPVNDAPVAFNIPNAGTFAEGTVHTVLVGGTGPGSIPIPALATDVDSVLTKASFSALSATIDGVAVSLADAGISYDPTTGIGTFDASVAAYQRLHDGEHATVVYTHQVSDGQATATAQLTYTVTGVNDAPTGTPTAALPAGSEDVAYTVTTAQLVQGLSDAEGDALAITGLTASNGTVTVNGDGSFTITPTANYNGPVTLSYGVSDGHGGTLGGLSNTYTLTPVNDPPTLSVPASVSFAENGTGTVATATSTDTDGATPVYGIAGGDDQGLFQIDAGTGALSFIAPPDFEAPQDANGDNVYVVDVSVSDGANVVTQTVSVTVTDVAGISRAGTPGADTYSGTPEADTLAGAAGNDTLVGLAGNDILDGGTGADSLSGGSGDDIFVLRGTEALADTISGGADGETLGDAIQVAGAAALSLNRFDAAASGIERWLGNGAGIAGTAGGDAIDLSGLDAASNVGTIALGGGNDTFTGTSFGDTIDGGTGSDSLAGGAGDDTYVVDQATDAIEEAVAGGTDTVRASVSYTLGAGQEIETLVLTGTAAINATGNEYANTLTGNAGANLLSGLDNDDTLAGGAGNDTLIGGAGADALDGGTGVNTASYAGSALGVTVDLGASLVSGGDAQGDTLANIQNLAGSGGDDVLTGDGAANTLDGAAGDDTVEGGAGNDRLIGGLGVDEASYEHAAGSVKVSLALTTAQNTLGAGTDTLTGFEALRGSAFADTLTGSAAANTLIGLDGSDRLSGGLGADTMEGGLGDDVYVVDDAGDSVVEGAGEGIDRVETTISYTLGDNVDNLLLVGTANLSGTGNDLDNALTGNGGRNMLVGLGGDDTLIGGAGADTMEGGLGDDVYAVDAAGDVVTELDGQGSDTVQSSIAYTLLANVENLVLTGTGATAGTGNELANSITGNTAANTLSGLAGDDSLSGGAGNDILIGGTGSDTLDGGAGIDTASYAASAAAVTVYLDTGVGSGGDAEGDSLIAIETLIGSAGADVLRGNSAANRIDGGAGDDTIEGLGGNDTLIGGAGVNTVSYEHADSGVTVNLALTTAQATGTSSGTDTLSGFVNLVGSAFGDKLTGTGGANTLSGLDGDDTISGGAGADQMFGGLGNDTFVVDAAGDAVNELFDQGYDTVQSSLTFTLGDNLEALVLTGAGAISGTGNVLANSITGNAAANALSGLDGNDTLLGGGGGDTLTGGIGNDQLTGGAGNDLFVFGTGFGADTITDFAAGAAIGDVIQLDKLLGLTSFADVLSHTTDLGADLQISFTDGSTLTLQNVASVGSLNANDFKFV